MTKYNERLDEILTEYATRYFQLLRTNAPRELEEAKRIEAKQAILDWHNRQVEQAMAKFHLKKGVKYDVKASDSVIVITHTNKLKERDDDQL